MILYMHTERTGGRRLALAASALATVVTAWWLSEGPSTARWSEEAPAQRPSGAEPAHISQPVAPLIVTRPVAAAAAPIAAVPPPPIQYVGQWMEGRRIAVVLRYQGRNVVVRVPGRVDERYEVVSANDGELVLRDLASATTQRVPLGAGTVATASAVTAAPPVLAAATPVPTTAVPSVGVRPGKLPPLSKRTSDELEPEN